MVDQIGLNVDHVGAACRRYGAQSFDEGCGDAAAGIFGGDGQILIVDLTAFAF